LDLTQLSGEEILQLRDSIMARARRTVDPDERGFDPLMMSEEGSDFFGSEDLSSRFGWNWNIQVVDAFSRASRRLGLAVISAGTAIAASNMFASPAAAPFARITLALSAIFGAWFVMAMLRSGSHGG
jgi:hypothetical protein